MRLVFSELSLSFPPSCPPRLWPCAGRGAPRAPGGRGRARELGATGMESGLSLDRGSELYPRRLSTLH